MPKSGSDQTRLIFHLSYDFKSTDGNRSVNFHTPKERCSVTYHDLDFAISTYLELFESQEGSCHKPSKDSRYLNCNNLEQRWRRKFNKHGHTEQRTIFTGKTDLKSAFRILGLSPGSWQWLIMKAQHPDTGEFMYFVDKCLPFGSSISCALFQRFSDALHYLIEFKIGVKRLITNYLDDFLFVALTVMFCNFMIQSFLDLCTDLGIPISMDKMEWASNLMVFLGVLLNGRSMSLAVPLDKKQKAESLLLEFSTKRKTMVKKLQQLCGYLNFLSKAITPGRTFVRCMYAKYSKIVHIGQISGTKEHRISEPAAGQFKWKQHHHVAVDNEFRLDCKIWLEFLQGELSTIFNRPMINMKDPGVTARDICFFSDASAAKDKGFGCLLNTHWIRGDWGVHFIEVCRPSIEYLELYALCAGVFTRESHDELKNSRIMVFCDNMAVVHMINGMTSSCKNCMFLLRLLMLNNLKFSRRLAARYVSTKDNFLADTLSCNQMSRFRKLGPAMDEFPYCNLPSNIWPISKVWQL